MIDPISFVIVILLAVGLSHALLPFDRRTRLFWVVAPGIFLLFITHPLALAFAVASFTLSTAIFLGGRAIDRARVKARIPYAILLLLFFPDISQLASESPILWLGSAFFIVRQMMTVAHGLKNDVALQEFFPGLLLSTFFFPALPSGPVFNGLRCWDLLGKKSRPAYGEGCYRLFEGLVYLFAVAGFAGVVVAVVDSMEVRMSQADSLGADLVLSVFAAPLASFAFLFATFYGYSRMAEGSALLFGFEVPQNFNKPHLARDLGDFWKRWHRSMADFVMQYIYLPLLVTTSGTKLALISAFVFMGLWHNFSPGFFVWGLGHGLGLAFLFPWIQRQGISPGAIRCAALAYVVGLSAVAHGVWSL